MYKKPFNVNFNDFQKWISELKTMYCSDSNTQLRMFVCFNGTIQIEHKGEIVWQGMQPFAAAERYNDLSDELTNKR